VEEEKKADRRHQTEDKNRSGPQDYITAARKRAERNPKNLKRHGGLHLFIV